MTNEDEHINHLEDLLICEPVSKRGLDALKRVVERNPSVKTISKEDFYKNLYVEPFFLNEKYDTTVTLSDDDDDDDENDDFAFSQKGIGYAELRNKKNKLEDNFLSKTTNAFFLIRGASGSGKTIYLNKLQEEWEKIGNRRTIEMDLEDSTSEITKGDVTFPQKGKPLTSNNGPPNAQRFFLVQLLGTAFDVIWEIKKSIDTGKIAAMNQNYARLNGENCPDDKVIFDFLYEPYCADKEKQSVQRGQLFQKLIDFCVPDYSDIMKSIMDTLKIITRVLLFSSDMENPEQTLIAFDSIEHYIDIRTRIYDSDIVIIVDSVYRFTEDETTAYKKAGLDFAQYFKVVMAVRDTTEKMFSVSVHSHFSGRVDNSIDVTRWYNTDEIYGKKLEYSNMGQDKPAFDFMKLIVSDKSKFNTSILELVSMMYNHNKRRVSGILTRVIGLFQEAEKKPKENKNILPFEKYETYWKFENIIYKYMLRRSILRLILNLIKTTKYFDLICTQNNKLNDMSTYARRILIWLSRRSSEKPEYAGFSELIEGVLQRPDEGGKPVLKPSVDNLAKTLAALDEFRFDDTTNGGETRTEGKPNKWCQLVVIKFNDTKYEGSSDLARKMWDEYQSESSSESAGENRYGVKITDAGRFFTYIQCDFEYFACRYCDSSTPLLLMRDYDTIEKTITRVYKKAKECIDYVIGQESEFSHKNFRALDDRNYLHRPGRDGLPFPYRIIKNHRHYLSHYIKIIELYEGRYLGLGIEEDNKLVEFINSYSKQYKKIYDDLINNQYEIQNVGTIKNYFKTDYGLSI
ncbi:MAG: hypothetical protein LBC76_11275 [Treponema sp.]|jgi:hypothetical protein|nr:hypothetical protein [Treponema sp.]